MARRRIGVKPLSQAMLTQFIDAYMQRQGEMNPTKQILLEVESKYDSFH